MTDSVRETPARILHFLKKRGVEGITKNDVLYAMQSAITDHGLTITDAARLAELEAAAVWNTDMDAAPKDGTEVRLKVTDARRQEVFEAIGYWGEMIDSDGDGWTSGRVADWGYQDVMRLNPIAWQTLTPHEGG